MRGHYREPRATIALMYTKHLLKTYSPDMTAALCEECGIYRPVVRYKDELYCLNDKSMLKEIVRKPSRMEAKEKGFAAKRDRLRNSYNMEWLDYLTLLDSQDYACAICQEAFTKDSPPHVDHDHACCPSKGSCGGCVRGLLCRRCNSGIGYFRDNTEALSNAVVYLSSNSRA